VASIIWFLIMGHGLLLLVGFSFGIVERTMEIVRAKKTKATIESVLNASLRTDIELLIHQGDPLPAISQLQEATGLPWGECSTWVKARMPRPQPPIPCPFCGKLLKTQKAKQCLECGMDWHDPNNVIRHSR
jgi:hypothetical protein